MGDMKKKECMLRESRSDYPKCAAWSQIYTFNSLIIKFDQLKSQKRQSRTMFVYKILEIPFLTTMFSYKFM